MRCHALQTTDAGVRPNVTVTTLVVTVRPVRSPVPTMPLSLPPLVLGLFGDVGYIGKGLGRSRWVSSESMVCRTFHEPRDEDTAPALASDVSAPQAAS